jgi:hypothetical protein
MFDRQYAETIYGAVPLDIWTEYRAKTDLTEEGEPITDLQPGEGFPQ